MFLYVIHVWLNGDRVPVAVFDTRARAEWSVEHELKAQLDEIGIPLSHCDSFTVDQWLLNNYLGEEACLTLTSYTRQCVVDRRLVAKGHEGASAYKADDARWSYLFSEE
jgi:hypothetical protein